MLILISEFGFCKLIDSRPNAVSENKNNKMMMERLSNILQSLVWCFQNLDECQKQLILIWEAVEKQDTLGDSLGFWALVVNVSLMWGFIVGGGGVAARDCHVFSHSSCPTIFVKGIP